MTRPREHAAEHDEDGARRAFDAHLGTDENCEHLAVLDAGVGVNPPRILSAAGEKDGNLKRTGQKAGYNDS